MPRATGCIPEGDQDTQAIDELIGACPSARGLLGAALSLPTQAMELADAVLGGPRYQGDTNSCVGHATCRAADARLAVQGVRAPYGSPLAAYTLGRMLGRRLSSSPIDDTGSYARLVLEGSRTFGVPREETWPLEMSVVNEELPPDVLAAASAWKVQGYYVIDAGGDSRASAVALALAKKHPVLAANLVDEPFMMADGKQVIGPPSGGSGHAVALLGYRTRAGCREFLLHNSWEGWGLPGSIAWVSAEWVASCFELYALSFESGSGLASGGAQ